MQHALNVSRALSMGNYHSLFHLYEDAPNMGAYIMDHFINRERVKALLVITKAYVFGVGCSFTQLTLNQQIPYYPPQLHSSRARV